MLEEEFKKLLLTIEPHNEQLMTKYETLIASHKEREEVLKNFAYKCAHDLAEPLRNIAIFTQLLEECTKGKRDNTAEEYMRYILANTKQMNDLIYKTLKR